MSDNEEIICLAAVKILNKRTGLIYQITSRPDRIERKKKDVDFILEANGTNPIAAEHTVVESFINQITHENISFNFIKRLRSECEKKIPSDRYFKIILPVDLIPSMDKKKQIVLLASLKEWIIDNAKHIRENDYIDFNLDIDTPKITLECSGTHEKLNGQIVHSLWVPQETESLRVHRIRKALTDKIPKLNKYRLKEFKTLLLLEDTDISLSNRSLIETAIKRARRLFLRRMPNYIYLFTTMGNDILDAWVLKEKRLWFNRVPERGPFYDF